jgi:hypothetical protein
MVPEPTKLKAIHRNIELHRHNNTRALFAMTTIKVDDYDMYDYYQYVEHEWNEQRDLLESHNITAECEEAWGLYAEHGYPRTHEEEIDDWNEEKFDFYYERTTEPEYIWFNTHRY